MRLDSGWGERAWTTGRGRRGVDETVILLSHFNALTNPRQRGKIIYPCKKTLCLCLLAVLADAETFVDIALLGEKKRAFSAPVPLI